MLVAISFLRSLPPASPAAVHAYHVHHHVYCVFLSRISITSILPIHIAESFDKSLLLKACQWLSKDVNLRCWMLYFGKSTTVAFSYSVTNPRGQLKLRGILA